MTRKVTFTEFARMVGVSPSAISRAVSEGRLTADGKLLDPVGARAQWETNRQRRRRTRPADGADQALPASGARDAGGGGAGGLGPANGASFWDAKLRRERAEATIAELKLAEMAGRLVLRSEVERLLFTAARVMRDQLLSIPPRLGATLAPLTDQRQIEERIAAELRVGLRAFAQQLRAGGFGGEPTHH